MASTSATTASVSQSQSTVDNKVLADLDQLVEKMDLCDSMLRPGGGDPAPSVQKDEALLSVIGFLEACAPRMVELVEAAAVGAVSEHVLMKCLEVNDRLSKSLADIDTVGYSFVVVFMFQIVSGCSICDLLLALTCCLCVSCAGCTDGDSSFDHGGGCA